tara:strand:- start:116 stop:433 length:318 start_codon:yes stop_codon:yes gene_type:complete
MKELKIKLVGLKKIKDNKTQKVCILIAINIVLYNPILSKILETKKPEIINPKEKEPDIIPIVLSEKNLYLAIITINVKKYPSPMPVKSADNDKYFILELILLKSI